MIPNPAQFLLRFDDLCPAFDDSRWRRFLPLIEEFGLRPILAIVPDNQDRDLKLSPPDAGFWAQMRELQRAGATIGLHGYRHLCASPGASLLKLHRHSEFAGVPEQTQREWIREGKRILDAQGLNPTIFVAPRHGFDRTTLRVLREEGIRQLSDGFARLPFTRDRLTWIPQQLWRPVEKSSGLWTICVHSNFSSAAQVDELRVFLRAHAGQFTSVDRVLTELSPARLSLTERLYEACALWRTQARRARRRRRSRARNPHRD
jgi:predicted deacetylase